MIKNWIQGLWRFISFIVLLHQLPIQAQTNYTPLAFSTLPNSQTLASVDVAVDAATNVYMVNYNGQTLQKITPEGIITNVAGMTGVTGTNDGFGSSARFYYAQGVAAAPDGTVYVADTLSHTIRKVTPAGQVTTFTGIPNNSGTDNSPNARFLYPLGIAVDGSGNVYVGDHFQVRKITLPESSQLSPDRRAAPEQTTDLFLKRDSDYTSEVSPLMPTAMFMWPTPTIIPFEKSPRADSSRRSRVLRVNREATMALATRLDSMVLTTWVWIPAAMFSSPTRGLTRFEKSRPIAW